MESTRSTNQKINDNRISYQGYKIKKRTITSSPSSELNCSSPMLENKNFNYKTYSPPIPEVSMPGGLIYKIKNEGNKSSSSINSRRSKKSVHSRRYETESDLSDSNSDRSSLSGRSKKQEKRKQEKLMMEILVADYLERKNEKNKEGSMTQNTISYKIPESEPIEKISKIPNYEEYSEVNKEKIRDKFRSNFNMLIAKYPKWLIEPPNFNLMPLTLIHKGYEKVVKDICTYQTAMKWKVYLVIIIAGIEYYGYNINKYTCLKGLLKAQIKTIHKYDPYLVEFAEKYSSDENGEDFPLWMRFLGTFLSGLASFSSINGLVKIFGPDASAPDFVFEQADKFVSPPEGTAKLRSDGISEVPDPPTGFQDPNSIINIISTVFSSLAGNSNTEEKIPVAQNIKPREVDDFDNADF